ncbi:hypothetical protein TWF506_003073 [Arthrobotrys conoides]|uniref:NB-ARC domain-containing protein n=1 Tax=Arthrobotrys conoides TaxID=74498 RepID=A0AAN8N3F6_9PEZI
MQRIIKEQARITWPESAPDYEIVSLKLGIPGLVDSGGRISTDSETISDIQSALFRWLQLPDNNKWLLIFDNADDLETFDIQEYFPNYGGGAILITSRRPEFSHSAEQADLEGLDKESAIKLLLSLAHLSNSLEVVKHDAANLVEKLGFMPLAISHAGCFIHEAKVPLKEYLPYYDKAFMAVQSKKPRFGWNYRDDTAATTWEISFSKIEEQDKEAALLLLICSYLNPEEIFEDLWKDEQFNKNIQLECRYYYPNLVNIIISIFSLVKNRIMLLASYSLVKIIRFGVFSIHPVVHSWARERLQRSEQFQIIRNVIRILGRASQTEKVLRESSKWDTHEERRIVSHLEYLHRSSEHSFSQIFLYDERTGNEDLFFAFSNIASVFDNQGKYHTAMQWYERALAGSEENIRQRSPVNT